MAMAMGLLKSLGIKLMSVIPLDDSKTGRNPFTVMGIEREKKFN